jgi:hypothetical protein
MEILTEKWNGKKDGLFGLGNIWGAYIHGQDLVSDPWTRTERDSEWPGEPDTWSLQPASTPDLPLVSESTQLPPTASLGSEPAPKRISSARLALNQNLHWPELPTEAIEAGVYLHRLMAKIHDREKSENVLQTWDNDESIAPVLRQKVSQWARSLLHRPDLEAFFDGRSTVLREHPVLLQDGSSLQPDLILLGQDGSARVLDFKTGQPRKEHRDQLEQYLEILQKAGYPSSGALVYTEDESVDAID